MPQDPLRGSAPESGPHWKATHPRAQYLRSYFSVGKLEDLSKTELSLEPVTVEKMELAIDNKEHVQEAIKGMRNTAIDHTEMKVCDWLLEVR